MSGPALRADCIEVPDDLSERDQWLLWKRENGTKVPYQVNGRKASSNNPETWTSFESAKDALRQDSSFAGIGFVFKAEDGLAGVDLDDCLVNGQLKPWARGIVGRFFDTYAEISPSGNGIKIWARGALPSEVGKVTVYVDGKPAGGIELYSKQVFRGYRSRVQWKPAAG